MTHSRHTAELKASTCFFCLFFFFLAQTGLSISHHDQFPNHEHQINPGSHIRWGEVSRWCGWTFIPPS